MKKISLAIAMAFVSILSVADEGMWLPILLKNNYAEMKRLGLKLTPEQLYDVNNSSLKDAICWFNGGCTSEIISDKGLVLTNHHCGYDAIAEHSTTADNILDNGFWAKTMGDEKANPGMWVSILVRMEDVSDKVNKAIAGLTGKDLEAKKTEIFNSLKKEATANTHYEASVRSFFKDNAFYLFVFEKFTDIRLVGAPPQSVGKFGGDTDNWMWPRHTGDFSMFRIYAGKDNKPATYAKDNVPYKPKHCLPVSLKGLNDGDFSMIYGFPGRTNRYENSYGVNLAITKVNPAIVALRDVRLSNWKMEMDKSDSVRLLMSSDYAQIANYWKYFIGQTEQLKRLKVLDEKKALETKFTTWAKDKPSYSVILPTYETAYKDYEKYAVHQTYMREGILGSAILSYALSYQSLEKALMEKEGPGKDEAVKKATQEVKETSDLFFKSFNTPSEERILAAVSQMYFENIPADQHPAILATVMKKYKGKTTKETFEKFAKLVFAKSIMASKLNADAFLAKPNLKKLQADPAYSFAKGFFDNYMNNVRPHIVTFNEINDREGKKYIKALMEMEPNKQFYPDANSTLRLTYGTIKSYSPKDAVEYKYFTTLSGVMEKENPKDFEFMVPPKLIELYKKKDFGQYADKNGDVPVAFISNNDITGGNSGSPVMNGDGELIGLAFDGNWEAMSGDIYFDSKYKRTISVDIRYVLFLIDKLGGASHIVNEMKLVK